jgi:hypothetical protein
MKAIALLACIFGLHPSIATAGFLDGIITITTTNGVEQSTQGSPQKVIPPTSAPAIKPECLVYDGFRDNGDGTLTDPRNGLIWQKCVVGRTWNGSACSGTAQVDNWYAAMNAAKENRFLGKSDWRLPTKAEMESIMILETSCYGLRDHISERLDAAGLSWTITPYGDAGYVSIHKLGGESYTVGAGRVSNGERNGYNNHASRLVRVDHALPKDEAVQIDREFQRLRRAMAETAASIATSTALEKTEQAKAECMQSNKPKLAKLSANIVLLHTALSSAKEQIQRQRDGAKYSGYVDKQRMYDLGNNVVSLEENIKEYFAQYKQLGGTAKSPELVKALPSNPCDSLPVVWTTKKELTNLSRLRYAQYGFLDSNKDRIQAVLSLEDTAYRSVTFVKGVPDINDYNIPANQVIAGFGFSQEDTVQLKKFLDWWKNRFKPIYFKHLVALNSVAPFKSLDEVEELTPDEKNRYLDKANYPEGPYDVLTNPFPDGGALPADKAAVMKATSVTLAAINK